MTASVTLGPLLIGLAGLGLPAEERVWLQHPAVGGVVLFTRNYADIGQLTALTASIREAAGRELLICVDHEGGRVQRFREGFTRLPSLAVLGKMYRGAPGQARDFAYRHARVMATELLLCGVDMSFAPVLDVGGPSVVIGDRALASDPSVIADLADAYIAGMHDAGMAATGKHFPGHGSVLADSHTDDVLDPRSLEEIRARDLRPFASLANVLDAVMMAHVMYPQADDFPAGYSGFWIRQVLRQELGFAGTVFSDDLGMFAAKSAGGLAGRVQASLEAGCDAVLVCDPADVRELMGSQQLPGGDASETLGRLRGKAAASRAEVERVGEWRQWKETIGQLEQWV